MARAIPLPSSPSAPTLGFYDVARRLGQSGRTPKYLASYIDRLIDGYGFPKPIPVLSHGRMVETAHIKSRWNRRAVEQWELDRLPPDAATAIDAAELALAGDRMDARAAKLFAANDHQVAA